MNQQTHLSIDIEPKSSSQAPTERRLWNRSDNTFRFNFLTDAGPASQEKTPPSHVSEQETSRLSFTGQASCFAFNFQIAPEAPVERMEMAESASSPGSQQKVREDQSVSQEGSSLSPSVKSKPKKKKSGKTASSSSELQKKPSEECEGTKEPTAEEQLNRELDWCIEQLELGLRSQKGTPKQKEEASRALKTLRSSKAPLVKKRQLMRAMTGDYRKKMEEEKSKQFRLIQAETASARVKVASDAPKKSVFHRKAEVREEGVQIPGAPSVEPTAHPDQRTADFVFAPSNEEFRFDFL